MPSQIKPVESWKISVTTVWLRRPVTGESQKTRLGVACTPEEHAINSNALARQSENDLLIDGALCIAMLLAYG